MDPMEVAKQMGKLAGEISNQFDLTATAIVTIEGKKVSFFFGSRKMGPDQMEGILKLLRRSLNKLIKEQAIGNLKPVEMKDDQPADNPFKRN